MIPIWKIKLPFTSHRIRNTVHMGMAHYGGQVVQHEGPLVMAATHSDQKSKVGCRWYRDQIVSSLLYSGPSILRPPMGPRTCGLISQVVLK